MEHHSKLPRSLVGQGLKRGQVRRSFNGPCAPALQFLLKARDRMVGNPAGNDQIKIAQIGGYIKREAVRSNAPGHMNANRPDLPLRPGVPLGPLCPQSLSPS